MNGATGMSDMHGKPRGVAESESGEERMNTEGRNRFAERTKEFALRIVRMFSSLP